jgi:RNA-directed DNA polymerase
MRAMSVLGNAKSNRHRKTHRVEPDGTGRKFMHLTRGGLVCESRRGVSRGHSSEEGRESGWSEGPKNQQKAINRPTHGALREVLRNRPERQLRQLPELAGGGGAVDPPPKPTARRQAAPERERRCKKMPEDKPREATLETVLATANLRAAWQAVKANGGAPGVDRMDMERSARHLREHWEAIRGKLLEGAYTPGAVRVVNIPKANGGERQLGIPNITDRLIQQAIHQVLSPVWEPVFSEHSHGFRPGRSAHDAVKAAQAFVKGGKTWVVDIDLRNFFDRIDHDKLMHLLRGRIEDKRLRALIGAYLRAPMQHRDGRKEKRWKGTPQGGPLSPLLANIYLDPLDKELEKRGVSFVRYADDIAIFASSERSAERIYESVVAWIERNLKLEVNREKSGTGPSGQSSLLGFRVHDDGKVGVSPTAVAKLKAKVRELWDARQSLTSEQLRDQWQGYIRGWWNYFQLADWRREVESLSGWIRRHMRKCFWLRWKTPRGRLNALKKLGVKGRALGQCYSSRGAWPMARHPTLQQALNNRTLMRHGFIIPWQVAAAPGTGG